MRNEKREMRNEKRKSILACKCDPRALILHTSLSSRGVHFDDSLEISLVIVATHTELLVDIFLLNDLSSFLFVRFEDRVVDLLFTILN